MANRRLPSLGQRARLWIELLRSLRLAWHLVRDPRVSLLAKSIIPGLVLLYMLSPVDLSPDFLPLLGQVDDLAVLLMGIRLFIALCPPEIVQEHEVALDSERFRAGSQESQDMDGPVVDTTYRVIEDDIR
jgi:uncharacterized membrane protein YkvA (DUF1232 family)